MIQSLRGMNDILAPQNAVYEHIIKTASTIAQRFGCTYIETPILEETALFKRSVGESSDIVGKEMYQFIDKGENDVCMRPEGTAGVVRAFIQAKKDRQEKSERFFYHGPMFRYERPQKGRLRQFHQFGVESFGEHSVFEDAAIITMIAQIFDALNITYTLKINSLGDEHCMPSYRDDLITFLQSVEDEICDDCKRRKQSNPIRTLDCKNQTCQNLYVNAPKLINQLCSECQSDFDQLQKLLTSTGIAFEIDTHLVRGLDYYSKTAFEFVSTEIGAQNAIAGGGRYDKLISLLGGRETPAIGFALGIERLIDLVQMQVPQTPLYYFGAMDESALPTLFNVANTLREKGHHALIDYRPRKLAAHLKNADKRSATFCAVIGENELKEKKIWLKDLSLKEEKVILIEDFFKTLA